MLRAAALRVMNRVPACPLPRPTPQSGSAQRRALRARSEADSGRRATSRFRIAPFCSACSPAARPWSRACSRATTCCAPAQACEALGATVERLAAGRWRIRGPGLGALVPPRDTLDFGNAGTGSRLMMGVVGGHGITATFDGDASLRKRPMNRILDPLKLMGAEVLAAGRGRPLPDHAQGRARPGPDPLPHAGRLGADQVGRAARRPQRARGDDRDRGRGLARPYREDARPFRGRGDGDAGGRGPPHRPRRPPGSPGPSGRRAGRPVVGGVPDRGGADRPRFGHRGRGRDDEPAALGAARRR